MRRGIWIGVLAGAAMVGAQDRPIPVEIQNRVLRAQKDQVMQQARIEQLQRAYQDAEKSLEKDRTAIESAQKDALAAEKLDPAEWTVDVENLVFVKNSVPAAKPPVPAKAEGKK